MLAKLLKYEIKATGRVFLPLYAGLLAVAIIAGFVLQNGMGVMTALVGFLLGALYVALVVITIILLIERFYQNLLRDEGYLMFTLPASPSKLIASKLITTCFWCVCSLIVGAAAGFAASRGFFSIGDLISVCSEFMEGAPWFKIPVYVIILMITALAAQLAATVLQVYFSLAVGQLPVFGGHRILFAILAYIGTSVIIQSAAATIGKAATPYFLEKFDALGAFIGGDGAVTLFINDAMAAGLMSETIAATNTIMVFALAFNLIVAAAMFAGTSWILSRKLNLE